MFDCSIIMTVFCMYTGQPPAAGSSSGSVQPQPRLETATSKRLCIVMINVIILVAKQLQHCYWGEPERAPH